MSRIYKLHSGKHIIVRVQILPNDSNIITHHEYNGWFFDHLHTEQTCESKQEFAVMLSVYDPQTETILEPDTKMEELLTESNKKASAEVQSVGQKQPTSLVD